MSGRLRLVREGAAAAKRDYEDLHTAGYVSSPLIRKDAFAKVKRQLSFILRNRFLDRNIAESGIAIDQQAIIAAMANFEIELSGCVMLGVLVGARLSAR